MNNYYDFFEQCMQSQGTNMTYCSKMANNIIPSKKYAMHSLHEMARFSITSNLSLKESEGEVSSWKVLDGMTTFTNDDAKYYLSSLLEILYEANYISEYDLEKNESNDYWVTVIKAIDEDKKSEIYNLFGSLSTSFNSRVLAYLS